MSLAAAGLEVFDLAAKPQDFFVLFEQEGKQAGVEGAGAAGGGDWLAIGPGGV